MPVFREVNFILNDFCHGVNLTHSFMPFKRVVLKALVIFRFKLYS